MTLSEYITTINQRYRLGNATEHTFRGDLQHLLESLVTDIRATNEPKRQSCGAPDYIITRGEIPVGFIEAKDIGDKDLEGKKKTGNQEQFDRYKTGLANLIFTDYLDFHFYKEGVFSTKISIGKIENGSIIPLTKNFDQFTQLFENFTETISQSINSPTRLAEMMAGKARLMADIIEKSLNDDDETGNLSNLKRQMLSFKKMLISDIDNESFSDLYSQTIAYGMFAARYHDPTLQNFSREEAVKLIPKSNPFLRKLFKDIADDELDNRLVWIVDELVSVFLASDVASIMKNFGKTTKQEDPVVHFYETFLGVFNPDLKKERGVWYTPQPIVNFIVRAVDDILISEFNLSEGLADTSKKKIKIDYQGRLIEKDVHKVQILDPATGTGTFLSETIKHIHKRYEGIQGMWSKYVENDLIPRINGFELLMASYAMAHLKLDMLLTETGYVPTKEQRLRVFLTNSLEKAHPDSGNLWGNLLSEEADQANEVKRDSPIMCVMGNPPYRGTSSNMTKWIMDLIEEYKDEVELKRKGRRWVQDDYVKFIRYGQYYIEKNGQGILAYINPHGFLDNPTFSGMRNHLLKTFDKIYTIDLHGNSNKKEVSPDGTPDINVFDIQQGVSINFFIKTGKKVKKSFGEIYHFDLYGKREFKYDFLNKSNLKSISFNIVKIEEPNYFFKPIDNESKSEYLKGIKIEELFPHNTSGIVTAIDKLSIFMNSKELEEKTKSILNSKNPFDEFKIKDALQSTKEQRIEELRMASKSDPVNINYRPFDKRCMYYTKKTHGWINSPRYNIMKHFIFGDNVGLVIPKINKEENCFFISKEIIAHKLCSAYDTNSIFPLYLYIEPNGQTTTFQSYEKTPNLNTKIVKEISDSLGLIFTNEKEITKGTLSPIDILDYIYGVLHSPKYREKYKEFLKVDFPRVPYPKDKDTFWKLVKLGGEIRQIHLLEGALLDKPISKYPITGTNIVVKPKYEYGKVFINESQYFEGVPEVAWNFFIGGYNPAQKWLKDRIGLELQIDDIRHYMKIIVALNETDRLMNEIDKIEI